MQWMIRVFDVYKTYDRNTCALAAISLHVSKGEMVFLTGPSGAGKTTLLRLLYGAEQPERGQIIVNGRNIARLQRRDLPALRRTLGMVFQDFKLLPERTVFDNIAFALRALGTPNREMRQRVMRLLERVGLVSKRDTPTRQLSGGEQQRVAIARALVSEPQLVLADEPTGNLDAEMTTEIMRLFVALHRRGTTVMIATHNGALVQKWGYRVIALRAGYLVDT
jgi:cell division transport system ATP-binding protein